MVNGKKCWPPSSIGPTMIGYLQEIGIEKPVLTLRGADPRTNWPCASTSPSAAAHMQSARALSALAQL